MVMPPNILEDISFRLGLFYPVTATTVSWSSAYLRDHPTQPTHAC